MRAQKFHELKTHPEYFEEVWEGRKPFELRKNDRDFQLGDVLVLREWHPIHELYSGRIIQAFVTSMVEKTQWLQPGVACLGLSDILKYRRAP